ncbi:hypothetical protein Pint_10657 [Pistacia integerrima]|uniref:Uncharacterized protein n=1 Tax=Pistacia integerrima TaxID=434235 RepID=A0ACC0XK20_9ROSI|nr:hypothetical protein Pint_10657 [Pistacia integerrima]
MGSNLVKKKQFDMFNGSLALGFEGEETGSGPYEIKVGIGGSSEDINGRANVEDRGIQGDMVSKDVGVKETRRVGKVFVDLQVPNEKDGSLEVGEIEHLKESRGMDLIDSQRNSVTPQLEEVEMRFVSPDLFGWWPNMGWMRFKYGGYFHNWGLLSSYSLCSPKGGERF